MPTLHYCAVPCVAAQVPDGWQPDSQPFGKSACTASQGRSKWLLLKSPWVEVTGCGPAACSPGRTPQPHLAHLQNLQLQLAVHLVYIRLLLACCSRSFRATLIWRLIAAEAQNLVDNTMADNTTANDVVGWVADRPERSTLTLIWSCVITIFACTWNVLHLNVPGRRDKSWERALRKAKWMVINILFPEFILSKAICDLRLAARQLQEFGENMQKINKPIEWTDEYQRGFFHKTVVRRWKWEVAPLPPLLNSLLQFSSHLLGFSQRLRFGFPYNRRKTSSSDIEMEPMRSSPDGVDFQNEGREQEDRQLGANLVSEGHERSDEEHQLSHSIAEVSSSEGFEQQSPCTNTHHDSAGDLEGEDQAHEDVMQTLERIYSPIWDITQEWTLVHSYYAQMGGLLYNPRFWKYPIFLTACQLTSRWKWDWENGGTDEHPLTRLVLSEKDIQDKSKADWLAKGLALLQVTWFVLNVMVRRATGLLITQIEIATVAFAIMAVFIYLANWWKPKDISESTRLIFRNLNEHGPNQVYDRRESFLNRLLHPGTQPEVWLWRVPNDFVWLEGDTPLLHYLMGGSSLIFGGLHCLAWNFEFPTQAELFCWRIASLMSAVLPVVALAINAGLGYVAVTYADDQIRSKMLTALKRKSLDRLPDEWWKLALRHPFWSWKHNEQVAFVSMSKESRNWGEKPTPAIVEHCKRNNDEWAKATIEFSAIWNFRGKLKMFRGCWVYALEGRNDQPSILRSWWYTAGLGMEPRKLQGRNGVLEFCREYEAMVSNESGVSVPDTNTTYVEEMLRAFNEAGYVFPRMRAFRERCSQVSNVTTIIGIILYAIARLIIIVLLFTSLRAAPAGVYQDTAWTRFLPNIS